VLGEGGHVPHKSRRQVRTHSKQMIAARTIISTVRIAFSQSGCGPDTTFPVNWTPEVKIVTAMKRKGAKVVRAYTRLAAWRRM